MIKIYNKKLGEILNCHFKGFCDKGKLKERLENLLDKCRRKTSWSKHGKFVEYLLVNISPIIRGNPYLLEGFIQEISKNFKPILFSEIKKNGRVVRTSNSLGNAIRHVFDYENTFCNNVNEGWNAYWLAEALNVVTCPYCNRYYTHTLIDHKKTRKGDRRIIRPDFDHFFDKATYPYLALSFFNLVPSCQICNSRLKHSKFFSTDTHLHPYIDGFGDFVKFQIEIDDVSFFHGAVDKAQIEFIGQTTHDDNETRLIKKAEKNIEDFKLKELYNEHKDYAHEVINKALIYNSDYLDILFNQYDGSLFTSKYDLIRFITGNYTDVDELSLRPLSKLTNDLIDQFELWKTE